MYIYVHNVVSYISYCIVQNNLCMYVCLYVCMYVRNLYVGIYAIFIFMEYAHMLTCVLLHTYMHMHMHTHMHLYMYMSMYTIYIIPHMQ